MARLWPCRGHVVVSGSSGNGNDMTKVGQLRGLYFPYARCLTPTFIKQSLLLFDQLVFADPLERAIRESFCYYNTRTGLSGHKAWDSIKDDYAFLEQKGLVQRLNPFPFIGQYDGLMAQAMLCDLQDEAFMRLSSDYASRDHWGILRGKIPPDSLLEDALEFSGTRFWRTPTAITSPREERSEFGSFHDFSSPFIMSVAHDYVPASCGYSINTNLALLLAEVEELTPITDDPAALQLLSLKYARAKKATEVAPAGPIIARRSPAFLQKYNVVGLNIVDAMLPDTALEKISFKSLVEFRDQESASLQHLRQLLDRLVTKVESELWSEEFENEMVRLIETEIIPEAEEARERIRSAYGKMFGGLIKRTAATMTPTLTMSFLAGLSAGQTLTMSCAAMSGALSIALPEIVDLWQEHKSQKKNSLSFLLQLARASK
jgi:hypothetical protein